MISIKEVAYKNYGKCLAISNELMEVLVTVDIGPRIIKCNLRDKENMMFEDIERNACEDVSEPVISAANSDMIWYSTPISAAKPLMDEELAESEIAFPDSSVLENTEIYINLSNEAKQLMDELWISIVRSNELTLSFWITVGVIAVASLALVFRNMYIKKKRLEARKKY